MKSKSTSDVIPSDVPSVRYVVLVVAIACATAIVHRNHLASMYEHDRHFSHLSTLERELGFRTEMGLYYSYFKTMIDADSVLDGLHTIMYDNVTEFPAVINTLKRFNLYPEVLLGVSYRLYRSIMDTLNLPTRWCWNVSRGQGLSPVLSCEGLGEPPFFYIEAAFLLNGILLGVFFVYGTYLSRSLLGGFLTVISFFYNHGECTRVQWTPPLRESFAYPFFVIQMLLVTHALRSRRPSYINSLFISLATICFMLPWQFAQFALLTQTLSVFGVYILRYIDAHKVKVILTGQMVGSVFSTVVLFGNKMMISSFFVSCVLSFVVVLSLESFLHKILKRFLLIAGCQVGVLCILTVILKKTTAVVLNVTDDAHITDILRSKFTDFKTFHTMLYTCAAEFDFMELETPVRVCKTLLLPSVLVVLLTLLYQTVRPVVSIELTQIQDQGRHTLPRKPANHKHKKRVNDEKVSAKNIEGFPSLTSPLDEKSFSKHQAEIFYVTFQLAMFTVLAVLIMRLKLFWTPQLCLVTSLLASRQLFSWVGDTRRHYSWIGVLVGLMSIQGYWNLDWQWSIMGEYENVPTEQLVNWINTNTPRDAAFAGPMSLMANIKLSTGRPIVNHPHYEDAELRARTMKVYSLFSRKSDSDIYNNLRDLNVTYAVLEGAWCTGRSRRGCSMVEIWDIEDAVNRDKEPACNRLRLQPAPYFTRVFRNEQYDILQLAATVPSGRS